MRNTEVIINYWENASIKMLIADISIRSFFGEIKCYIFSFEYRFFGLVRVGLFFSNALFPFLHYAHENK